MTLKHAAQWAIGLLIAGFVLLLLSIFVADRQLEPPFQAAELEQVEVPRGAPLAPNAVLYASDSTGNYELYAAGFDSRGEQLTSDPDFDSWRPRLSPSRETVLFYRTPAGVLDTDLGQASLWMIDAQGGEPVQVLPVGAHGWTRQGGAEWSPAGAELVMMGERPRGMQIWVTSVDGRDVRSLVNEAGDNTDPSWSPDAKRILFVACAEPSCPSTKREVFAVLSGGGEPIQITSDDVRDEQPKFSPDGSQIVMRSQFAEPDEDGQGAVWDIRVIPTNRSQPPRRLVNDTTVSGSPVWLDNQNVIFDRVPEPDADAGLFQVRLSDAALTALVDTPANERFAG